ncbi:unnamed protein product [Thlaspi arvense]|uniref:Leucine-rich repeat-containing N-terminal plant-type domain-containing protein n=1 Tax=Thlaspi arvense TaxID=13288 RepID=A0AAU9SL48_THLAR|nr:unnamed protein product [Thlaspi arvense]
MSPQSQPPELDPQDKASLLIFRVSIYDPNRTLSTWYGSTCSNWTGLSCQNPTGKVLSLTLSNTNLSGQIHPSLCKLTSLQSLDLSWNNLSGNIPSCVGALRNLRTLNLSRNSLVGAIPGTFVNLKELREVVLRENRDLGGLIPHWLGDLMNLERIDLNLSHLNLSFNGFSYEISPSLVFSEKLVMLDLSHNGFSGRLPSRISETTERLGLILLDLSHNRFSGVIPLRITELTSLQALRLSHNLLTGDIPARIGNLTDLQVIDLSHNALTGPIPLNIVGCFQLLALVISNNNLSGEIQPELDALDSLKILDISNNKISGEIPLTLAGLKSLEIVDISSNNLSGNLNEAITKWSNLKYLSLARNKFGGTLPSWLFKFDKIQMIDYSSNRFSWFIPGDNLNSTRFKNFQTDGSAETPGKVEIKISANVVAKDELSFSYSQVTGNISAPPGLTLLNLSHNCFSGIITEKEGLGKFPGALAGNPEVCVESSGIKCDPANIDASQEEIYQNELVEGSISIWIFCLSAFISFDFGVLAIFCSACARSYILQTKERAL